MSPNQMRSFISSLSPQEREVLLEQLEVRQGVNQLEGRKVDAPLLAFAESLLQGRSTVNPYARRGFHRSGRCKIKVESK